MPEGFLSFQRSFSILLYQSFSDVIFEVKLLHQSSNNSVSSNISLLIRSAFFFVSSSGWIRSITIRVYSPASWEAVTPLMESSTPTVSSGFVPSFSQAFRCPGMVFLAQSHPHRSHHQNTEAIRFEPVYPLPVPDLSRLQPPS